MEELKTKKRTFPVYVLKQDGTPLMPTRRFGWVRRGLRDKKLKVKCLEPFTVQLMYEPETNEIQEVTVGIDIGHTHEGVSVTTETYELYTAEVKLRTDIKEHMHERSGYRRRRRSCGPSRPKKKDFSKPKGWLAPI